MLLAAALTCAPAYAANITVDSSADDGRGCTLRNAILTAQNAPGYAAIGGCGPGSAGVDRIVVPAGRYALTAGGPDEDAARGGDLDLTESVIIEGAGAGVVTVDAGGRDRVFHILGAGVRAELSGLTITNGNAGGGDGGGLYVLEGATLVLHDAVVSNSVSNIGGGGVDALGDLDIRRTIIEGNRTQNDGGLRCLTSCTGHLEDVIVRNNTATGNVGGGLGAAGRLSMLRVQVLDNVHTGQLGAGGISSLQLSGNNHEMVIVDSLIAGNTSTGDGGGLRVSTIPGFFDGAPQVAVVNTTIVGNRAERGAGVSVGSGRATMSSVTIADNVASGEGGGLLRTAGRAELRNSIIARNRAARGLDCRGAVNSLGHLLVGRTGDCAVTGGAGNKLGSAAPLDAGLAAALADNGGPSRTLALSSVSSPAVNAGDPAGCSDGTRPLTTDQRGLPRVAGGRCDLGAFELDSCGNGTLDPGERCDDGGRVDGDCCSAACVPAPLDTACDDGRPQTTGDRCTTQGTCVGTSPTCGDRVVDMAAGETCDDGNLDDTDLCSSSCNDTTCGDGVLQTVRGEVCDDGASNSDTTPGACRTTCQRPSCEDGVDDPGEMCMEPSPTPTPTPTPTSTPTATPRPTPSPTVPGRVEGGCTTTSAASLLPVLLVLGLWAARRRAPRGVQSPWSRRG
jgi:cysteine-rich repeat protein